jgi:hypothetical protein
VIFIVSSDYFSSEVRFVWFEYCYFCLWGPFAWRTFFQLFTVNQCLLFSVRWDSCGQHMVGFSFLPSLPFYVFWLRHWCHWHSLLVLRDVYYFQSFLFANFLLFTCSFFSGLLDQKGLFFLASSCITLISSVWKSPLNTFCSAGLVVVNSFSFCLL